MLNFYQKRKKFVKIRQYVFLTGLMILSLFLIFLALYQSKKFQQQDMKAGGFGVSPPYLYFDDLQPGDEKIKHLRILRNMSETDWQVSVKATPPEVFKYLEFLPGKTLSFLPDSQSTSLTVKATIPLGAYSGQYKGYLDLLLTPADKDGVRIGLGLRVDFRLSIVNGKEPLHPIVIYNNKKYLSLKGFFIIKPQDKGKIFYVSVKKPQLFFVADKEKLWQLIQEQGFGITNERLSAIPVQLLLAHQKDSDNDGLDDDFEKAFGTNPLQEDSDGDGFSDFAEIKNGYNPLLKNKALRISYQVANLNKGKILLQVNDKGQAWYVNPQGLTRYYLSSPMVAWEIIKDLSVGISNKDFNDLFFCW